jgi:hypothetical protein|tara:strand:+ start:235 stop:1062 length:828 start_codon:yes stop_codon:yes gene_type:complete
MLTKTRHNKKRNTAFIYEALVRELTKCIVAKDTNRKGVVVSIVKEHFGKDSSLRRELDLYKVLYETTDADKALCEKMISEVKRSHGFLDRSQIFAEQTALINKINKALSKDVFSNFVANYKDLATISQILNPDVSVKHRVLLEGNLAETLSSNSTESQDKMAPIDNLVYKTFVKKFNEQYEGKLLENQQKLLSRYIASFHDDGVDLKIFLNEEIGRLTVALRESLEEEEIQKDTILSENTNKVLSILDGFKNQEIGTTTIEHILKIQSLVEELRD